MDLNVGDRVIHRGSWGRDKPEVAKVTKIQRNEDEGTNKYITTISWDSFHAQQEEYVVGLSDGHWAYAYQINPVGWSTSKLITGEY